MTKPTTAVIGTGKMGNPMALNLLQAGYDVTVYDIRREATDSIVDAGGRRCESPMDAAMEADILILSLVEPKIVASVLFGEQGITHSDLRGKVIIDTSTGVPSQYREWASQIAHLGGSLLDAPVTGGETGAQQGTLTFMVGGEADAFSQAKEILEVLGSNIVHVGASGAGQVAKAANQMIMSGYFAVIAETFAYVEKLDTDLNKVLEAIETGGGQSKLLTGFANQYRQDQAAREEGAPLETDRHYPYIFKKDLHCALQDGFEKNCYMPVTAAAHEVFKQMLGAGTQGAWPIRLLDFWRKCLGGNEK